MTTICAISTAQGGAIGIVRVSGPQAIVAVNAIFSGKQSLAQCKANTVHYGTLLDGDSILDEVLITPFHAPNSYTGEDSVEIACHGSSYILNRVLQLLLQQGCTMAQPGEYTQRAFLNGKMDLSQAEAVADLIAATNAASHRVALTQMRGGFSQRLANLRQQLLQMTSLLELELDFSEEEVTFADRQKLRDLGTDILHEIQHLSASFSTGNALKNGIPVAIIGAPNVGKSTLLNQLLQEERAIVTDIEGTTRDLIEDTLTLQGITFRFIDTAGLRTTTDTIEAIGIQRSLQAAEKAHIVILMTEPGKPYPKFPIREDQTAIFLVNKIDIEESKEQKTRSKEQGRERFISAKTGFGIEDLKKSLVDAVPPLSEDPLIVTNIRHKQALDAAAQAITNALQALNRRLPSDLIAEDLHLCLSHLAEILGEITSQSVLENIFAHFCIGK